ncbi:diguanylate cyclase [Thermodesulfomicrobium sp. WS]|uniref:sensor domain-containing diguanylate cyclase n=1 Tax=Thermodesulfomicrobium sp. WS TaxID=3004129 RepID=UPI002493BBA1|nr:diguanylate cyclase [Thermodesulfomicrobium sp. WS]
MTPSQELAALRAVFDSLAEHVAVLDHQGVIRMVNAPWQRFVADNGGDPQKIVGKSYLEVCATVRKMGSEQADQALFGLREILAGRLTGFHMEYPCHSPTQRRWFVLYARPWMMDGELHGAVVSHLPITQRKEAEYVLQRYERAVALAPFLVSIVDTHFRYVVVNDTYLRYHARRREEIEGHSVAEVMGEESFTRWVRPHLERCFAGETIQYEAWFPMAGMGKRCMAVTYYPCIETDGRVSGAVVSARDVTDRRLLEDQLRRTAALLAETQALAHVGSLERDLESSVDVWSDELFRILGYAPGEVPADFERFLAHVHPDDLRPLMDAFVQAQGAAASFRQDVRLRTCRGEERWAAVVCSFDTDEHGAVARMHCAVADITDRRLAELRLEELAATDQLTGLANRRHFFERLHAEVARARRFGSPLCVAMVDVDHFKRVNDTYGHAVGDTVLATVAAVLRESVRAMDVVARVGGEEFAVILPETEMVAATGVLERIRQTVGARPMAGAQGQSFGVTVSCGVAQRQSGASGEELLSRADDALYAAKAAGRNQVQVATGADEP